MAEPSLPEESIFAQALEIESAAERAAFLDRACDNNLALRAEVEALLRAHERDGDLLDLPENPVLTTDLPAREGPETIIGPYKLLEQIGEGGMGAVWMAEQTDPIQRRVAVKVVKEGMDSKQVLARFEAERQALALMEHPNIAKVLDAGRTLSGRPYFVMELVKGQAITKYCDEKRLAVRERLELFGEVCRAVQHAHQKGIIHRDLKPSNVLVAPYDGKPVVKVIDFGVAKATGQRLTDKTLFTGFGALVGTPEYMSPEQAEVNNQDIDIRSDIYSLGVLLYELLTGSTPLTRRRIKETALLEVLRVIREEEPPRPSTRLAESKDSLPSISAQRQTEPVKLTRLVRGELDWIVMKALEKDRNRRYETANGFAMDVQRYLADEPVLACPPSAGYRLRKFARRNKTALAVSGLILFFIALLGGGGGWVVRDRIARRAETEKVVSAALEESDSWQRERRLPDALSSARRAYGLLAAAEVDEALGQRVRVRLRDLELVASLENVRLEKATAVKDGYFDDEGAEALYGQLFRDAGLDVEALSAEEAGGRIRKSTAAAELAVVLDEWAAIRRARRGADDPSWKTLLRVARLADPDPWRTRVREALEKRDRQALWDLAASGEVFRLPPQTLAVLGSALIGADKRAIGRAVVFLREAQRRHPDDFWLNDSVYFFSINMQPPQVEEAVRFAAVAVALRPGSPGAHINLGLALKDKGKLDEAIAEFREAIRLKKDYAYAHTNLGNALHGQKKLDEAIAEFREAIALDPKLAQAHTGLGALLRDQGMLDEAIAEHRKAIALDPKLAQAHLNLGSALNEHGEQEEAITCFQKAIALNSKLADAHFNLGVVLHKQGKLDEAIAEYRKAIELDPKDAQAHSNLGNAFSHKNMLPEAIASSRKAIELDPNLSLAHFDLGVALANQKKLDEAIASWKKAIELDPKLGPAHYSLGVALAEQKKLDEAIASWKKAIALKPDDAKAHYSLGVALANQKKLDEAIAEYRKVIELDPKFASAYYGLGMVLAGKGRWDLASAEYRKAIAFKPDYAEAHCNLGQALQQQCEFREALDEVRRGHELGAKDPRWPYPSAQWVRRLERLVDLDARLSSFLEGKTTPASPAERVELAGLCTLKRLHRAAARFYEEAFAAEPKLVTPNRYNAACTAALAGCGQGKDPDKLDDKERARLRRQALDWLRADLDDWGRLLDKEPDKVRPAIAQQMRHWLDDSDFAGVRGPQALAKLPEPEREPWQKLWDDVANTLARAKAKARPEEEGRREIAPPATIGPAFFSK